MNRRNFLKWFGLAPAAPIAAVAAAKIDDATIQTVINQIIDQKNLESRPEIRAAEVDYEDWDGLTAGTCTGGLGDWLHAQVEGGNIAYSRKR